MTVRVDCIVLGVGGFGSACLYHLARRGVTALGLEQYGIAHDRGSSHGETRIIRQAYFEHPDYVPLLKSAYARWSELEQRVRRTLLTRCGLFLAGRPDCEAVHGTRQAAEQHHLPLDVLTPSEARERFQGFAFDDDFSIVFERNAGYLEVEQCVASHIRAAQELGAEIETNTVVRSWQVEGTSVRVETDARSYCAGSLIITAGPWAGQVLRDLGLPLQVVRKPVGWFHVPARSFGPAWNTPTYFYELPGGAQFYGFPSLDGQTIKVAEHTGGQLVDDPADVDRRIAPEDFTGVRAFLSEYLPGVQREPVSRASVCLYTKTPDSHFIIDRHPNHPQVALGAGFSGHGFKFTSVLGEALADLACERSTTHPIGFLSLSRPGLRI